jgi:histidinol dehydrogenase
MASSKTSTKLLRVLKSDESGFERQWRILRDRSPVRAADIEREVGAVVERIRADGDAALLDCVREVEGIDLDSLEVGRDEWDAGVDAVAPPDRAAIGKAAMRIRDFHRKRIPSSWEMREEGGAYMGQRVRALARVAVYVEGGDRIRPSEVIMNTVPASAVEVPEIILATPPRTDGSVAPELLMAARVSGVHRVFKMGGAHAIAALALGTERVPRVDKIVGTGDARVVEAKRRLFGAVAVDPAGGAGETCVIADNSATPAWLAADLIARAEQGEPCPALLLTHYKGLVTRVQEQLAKQLKGMKRGRVARQALGEGAAAIVTRSLEESLRLANEYAPEYLVLAVDEPELVSKGVQNAGAILLGHYTPVAVGDYLAGPNHVLPRGGAARFLSPLGVEDFLKRTAFIKFEPPKLRELGADVIRLATIEGLEGHGTSVDLRLQKIRRARREREAAREAEF